MKIIQPSVKFYGTVPTDYESAIKFIEVAGRTCYKSEDKITEGSAEKFVKKLIKAGHLAMVEHSNFVIRLECTDRAGARLTAGKYLNVATRPGYTFIGGNLTAWYQRCMKVGLKGPFKTFAAEYGDLFELPATLLDFRWQVCPHEEIPKELHRYAAKFICDRGVSHELVRHRPCSFAQESTRYVNYFGKEMEFIEPAGFECWSELFKEYFKNSLRFSEAHYVGLIRAGFTPQQARAVLPNALKTEIVVTADAAEWQHIRTLRTASAAHPDMQRVMNMMPWEEIL